MTLDFNSIDYKINSFLDFWEEHGRDPDELRVDKWQIFTPGCDGDFGCCSKHFDLATLVDALYELTGRNEPPFDSGVTITEHKAGAVQPVLIKDFDEFVEMFGGAETAVERPVLKLVGPEVLGDLQADINNQHGQKVGTVRSGSAGFFPPVTIRTVLASNGDPGCVDIIMEQGGLELERHKNKALDPNHPSVPQSERDAIEKERRDAEETDPDPNGQAHPVAPSTDGDAPAGA